MKTMRKRILAIYLGAIAASLSLAGGTADPAWSHPSTCPAGLDRFIEYRLFFGRSRQGVEVVSDAAWDAFLADEITTRFPDGLTVLDAAGQWRDSSGTVNRERAKLVIILAGPTDGAALSDRLKRFAGLNREAVVFLSMSLRMARLVFTH